MKSVLKALILLPLRLADAYSRAVARLWPSAGFAWADLAYGITRDSRVTVRHARAASSLDMTLYTPNAMCRYRTDTFSTKEPETLEWIDRFGGDGAFYDTQQSVPKLGLVTKSNSVNDLTARVVIAPTPLTSENHVVLVRPSILDEGGSMSTFGVEAGQDGSALEAQLVDETTCMALDSMVEQGLVPQVQTMMTIAVVGIEHFSRRGAEEVLALSGFFLLESPHSEVVVEGIFESTFNQVLVWN